MTWPFRRELQPLDRLEHGVQDESAQLASLLRIALLIGGHAASEPLKQWALSELNGYARSEESIPDYRRIPAPIHMDSVSSAWQRRGERISVRNLPEIAHDTIKEEVAIPFGVGHLENLIARTSEDYAKFDLPGAGELRMLMSAKYRQHGISIEALYWSVSVSSLHDIVDQVRTRLTQFVAELRSTMPTGAHQPTPEQVHRAVQHINITTGDNSPVTLSAPMAYSESGSTAVAAVGTPELRRRWSWRR